MNDFTWNAQNQLDIIDMLGLLHDFIFVYWQDDILPKLLATSGSHEDLFKKEIAKYDSICEEIAQNIEAQEQLLLQIQVKHSFFLFQIVLNFFFFCVHLQLILL